MKILVTGASGFIGSFIIEKGLELGHEMWAGVRNTSSREFLQDSRIKFIELNIGNPTVLEQQLKKFSKETGKWDCIIHAAGATKCIDKKDFMRINFEGTKNLIDTVMQLNICPTQFIYLSSLSVYGPVREEYPYMPIQESDEARPNTAYGHSKLMSEAYIRNKPGLPYVIFRPTGVYGPREKDYFKMAQSISRHIDFSVGYKPQTITFIYVKDLVKAIYLAVEKRVTERCYFVSEPQGYDSRSFSKYIQRALGIERVIHIKAPLWVLKTVSVCSEFFSGIAGKASTLNSDKYNIMKQRNWLCDTTKTENELNFNIDYNLEKGTDEMIQWYKENKWL